jgi:hypothetical protein
VGVTPTTTQGQEVRGMSMETTVLLRTILFQVLEAKNMYEIETAIKAMCTKDDIAAVKEQIEERRKHEANEKK